ncbi:hypothetical protein EMIT0P44_160046 [Pseudomonas sp. IT-P44]
MVTALAARPVRPLAQVSAAQRVVRWATTWVLTAAILIPATGTNTSISTRTNTTDSTISDSKTRPGAGFFIFASVTSDRDLRPQDDEAGGGGGQVPDGDVKRIDVETDSDDPDISGNECSVEPSLQLGCYF